MPATMGAARRSIIRGIYVAVLARNAPVAIPSCFARRNLGLLPPGALRNGAPFKDWLLPAGLAVEAACAQAMSEGVRSSDVIINILARQRDPGPAASILTPDALRLRHVPAADCARYDRLRST
jgi:hypothetical protein